MLIYIPAVVALVIKLGILYHYRGAWTAVPHRRDPA